MTTLAKASGPRPVRSQTPRGGAYNRQFNLEPTPGQVIAAKNNYARTTDDVLGASHGGRGFTPGVQWAADFPNGPAADRVRDAEAARERAAQGPGPQTAPPAANPSAPKAAPVGTGRTAPKGTSDVPAETAPGGAPPSAGGAAQQSPPPSSRSTMGTVGIAHPPPTDREKPSQVTVYHPGRAPNPADFGPRPPAGTPAAAAWANNLEAANKAYYSGNHYSVETRPSPGAARPLDVNSAAIQGLLNSANGSGTVRPKVEASGVTMLPVPGMGPMVSPVPAFSARPGENVLESTYGSGGSRIAAPWESVNPAAGAMAAGLLTNPATAHAGAVLANAAQNHQPLTPAITTSTGVYRDPNAWMQDVMKKYPSIGDGTHADNKAYLDAYNQAVQKQGRGNFDPRALADTVMRNQADLMNKDAELAKAADQWQEPPQPRTAHAEPPPGAPKTETPPLPGSLPDLANHGGNWLADKVTAGGQRMINAGDGALSWLRGKPVEFFDNLARPSDLPSDHTAQKWTHNDMPSGSSGKTVAGQADGRLPLPPNSPTGTNAVQNSTPSAGSGSSNAPKQEPTTPTSPPKEASQNPASSGGGSATPPPATSGGSSSKSAQFSVDPTPANPRMFDPTTQTPPSSSALANTTLPPATPSTGNPGAGSQPPANLAARSADGASSPELEA